MGNGIHGLFGSPISRFPSSALPLTLFSLAPRFPATETGLCFHPPPFSAATLQQKKPTLLSNTVCLAPRR